MLGFKSEPNKNHAVESTTKFLKIQLQARSKLWSGFFSVGTDIILNLRIKKNEVEQTTCPL